MSKLQGADFKVLADLTAAGATAAQLLNDTQVYVSANGLNQQLSSAITAGLIGGSGGLNYIANPSGKFNLNGVTTYATGSATPTGTRSGTPALTITQNTSTPIITGGNYLLTLGNTGDQAVWTFTTDPAQQAKVQTINFDYNINSGTYSDGLISVYIRDVTNNVIIYPTVNKVLNKIGYGQGFKTSFQSAVNSTSYELILLQTSSGTATLNLANITIAPQSIVYGSADIDSVPYVTTWAGSSTNPAIGNGTLLAQYGKRGEKMLGRVTMVSGTTTTYGSGNWSFTLPAGLSPDLNKIVSSEDLVGVWKVITGGTRYGGNVTLFGNQLLCVVAGGAGSVGSASPATWAASTSGQILDFYFEIPIMGWSGGTLLSSDASTRNISSRYGLSTAFTTTANAAINYDKLLSDTAGAVTTGSPWKFVCPVSGPYDVSLVSAASSSASASFYLAKNGSMVSYLTSATTTAIVSGATTVTCVAGDVLDIRTDAAVAVSANSTTYAFNTVCISLRQGPAQIAGTESINMRYTNTAGSAVGTNSGLVIPFPTKTFDSFLAYNTSTGNFTAPVNGLYAVKCSVVLGTASYSSGAGKNLYLYKNGALYSILDVFVPNASASFGVGLAGGDEVFCLAGDTLSIAVQNNEGTGIGLSTAAGANHLSIVKVG